MRRTLTTLIATIGLLLSGLAAPFLMAPAGATTPVMGAAPVADAQSSQHSLRAKPKRKLHDSIVKRHGKLYFKGRVDPGHGPVIIQKKACKTKKCHWKRYKVAMTRGPQKRWEVRISAPRHGNWYWRGYVKAYGGYARSWTGTWRTYSV